MSEKFVAVQWNKRKVVYDLFVVVGVLAYVQTFKLVGTSAFQGAQSISYPILEMRAWGSCAFLMLTAILAIGPAVRLVPRLLPLLYNRRHFGVIFFLVAVTHARHVLGFYHDYGDVSVVESLLTYDTEFTSRSMPFQLFGLAALVIFFLLAVTSHDFWQKLLGARTWKSLHMFAYLGYLLIVLHVVFGAMQDEPHPLFVGTIAASVVLVGGLHVVVAVRSCGGAPAPLVGNDRLDAGPVEDFVDGRPKRVVTPNGEDIAVVRHGNDISAVTGVCAHQGGPLAEGRIVDGCLTCPWHGWQYRPDDGLAPPPFTEKIATHRVEIVDGRVVVETSPRSPGTRCEPARIEGNVS